ncbi:MAG: AMP-binding protein [Caldilineaceae bacterium]|nr:AMP-binding protein [Caldilineaceae bacterium]
MAPTLTIAGHEYTPAALRNWDERAAPADLSEHARYALEFSREWLGASDRFVVRTSGSTGEPKAIELSRRQMEASAVATGKALGLRAGMQALVCLPTRYIAGRMMLVRGFVLQLAMTLVDPAADPLAALPPSARFDFTAVVPMQLQTLLDGSARYRTVLDAMRAVLVGGAPVSAALERAVQRVQAPIYHTYGMTETATHVALRRLNGPAASETFTPLPGVELAQDARGCLAIRGPMSDGRWLQTNDLVELRDDGTFVWCGRWDNVINSGGVKVHVEQVERAIERWLLEQSLPGQEPGRFFVAGLPDDRLGQRVSLIVEGAAWPKEMEQQLRAALAEQLDRYELPRRIIYVPDFVTTPTGKIDRSRTLERVTP